MSRRKAIQAREERRLDWLLDALRLNPEMDTVFRDWAWGSRRILRRREVRGAYAWYDLSGHLRLVTSTPDGGAELPRLLLNAPSWLLFGWRSNRRKKQKKAEARSGRRAKRRQLRNRARAKISGPRWGWLAEERQERQNGRAQRRERARQERECGQGQLGSQDNSGGGGGQGAVPQPPEGGSGASGGGPPEILSPSPKCGSL